MADFAAKIDFPIEHFMLPLLMLNTGSLKSLHTLFGKYEYLDQMLVKFEQNRVVRNTQNFDFFFAKKWLIIFHCCMIVRHV